MIESLPKPPDIAGESPRTPPPQASSGPVPWRGGVAGAAAAGVSVALVNGLMNDDQLVAFLYMPPLILAWSSTAGLTLRTLGVRCSLAVSVLGLLLGGLWAIDLPYHAGTFEWNVAVQVASACGLAMAEWLVESPSLPKAIAGMVVSAVCLWTAGQISQEVNQRQLEEAAAQTPIPYTVDVDGWSVVDVVRFSADHSSVVKLRVDESQYEAGIVRLDSHESEQDARLVCRSTGDSCRRLERRVWTSQSGEIGRLFRETGGDVVSMEFYLRAVPLRVAVDAMDSLRPLTDDELADLHG